MKILFVCTGNTCRSPMAELYFNFLMQQQKKEHRAKSAGLSAFPGGNISSQSAEVMRQHGIDPSSFRSSAVTKYSLDEADLVICMTGAHADAISSCCPEYQNKLRCLMDWSSGGDVPDPFGGSVEQYLAVFEQMKKSLEALAGNL